MMPALQYLRHGKALCGKVFKRFVETFNYHNDFIANLRGDGDLPSSEGCINLDLTEPKHPVIRLNRNKLGGEGNNQPAQLLHPWKVFAVGKSEDVEHCFEIYVPEGSVHVGEASLEVEYLTPVEGKPDRYTLDCEDEISDSAVIYLAIVKEEEESDGVSPDGENAQPEWKARIVSTLESIEDAKDVLAVLPIAKLSIDGSGEHDVGKVVAQYAHSAVAFTEGGADPDKISIDTVTAEDAEDPDALQVKDFDNDKSNGQQGLAQRLRVVKDGEDSFHLEADGAEVFIVARVKGRLKYIPLTGSKDKDPDEVEGNPCDHPGDTPGGGREGGVSPDDDVHVRVVDGDTPVGGPVPAAGDSHAGEPCPDCSPTGQGVPAE